MVEVSIVIRAFNEAKHIGKLLNEIDKQSIRNKLEVILVDSGSSDDTVKIAKEFGTKIVSIKPEEFTFGRALNLGVEVSIGKFLVFASAHVFPVDNFWIEKIIQPFENEKIVLSYGKQIGAETSKYSEYQIFEKWFPDEDFYIQEHPFCNNANTAIRKAIWEQQQYDESLTGLEDLDWANKVMRKGYNISYVCDATIVHVHDEEYSQVFNRYKREAIAYKRIFPEAHFSFLDFLILFPSNFIFDCIRAFKEGVFIKEFLSILKFRYYQFWGTYLGYKYKGPVTKLLKKRFYYPKRIKYNSNTLN